MAVEAALIACQYITTEESSPFKSCCVTPSRSEESGGTVGSGVRKRREESLLDSGSFSGRKQKSGSFSGRKQKSGSFSGTKQKCLESIVSAWNWSTLHFSSLPAWLQDNDYLKTGHRPPLSYQGCFISWFRLHTETWNIWTHFLGAVLFLYLAIRSLIFNQVPSLIHGVSINDQITINFNWDDKIVLGTFFAGAVICLGMSSIYHTLSCHSPGVCKVFSRLDYCGISLLITGSFVPWLYYGFYCERHLKLFYLFLVSILGVTTVIVALSEFFSLPKNRPIRAGVFMAFGFSGLLPAVHWLISQDWINTESLRVSFIKLVLMGILYVAGTTLYALRIPERFFPGKFDVWFHSHQLFHFFVLCAAFVHYLGINEIAIYRVAHQGCTCTPSS